MNAAQSEPLPLSSTRSHEDKRNRQRQAKAFGAYDGRDVLPLLRGEQDSVSRTLFWRLQGQAAILNDQYKLIRLSHRPAQLFQPNSDVGEQEDLAAARKSDFLRLFKELGNWEASLPTAPLWDSSPYWHGQSAKHYDEWGIRDEPK